MLKRLKALILAVVMLTGCMAVLSMQSVAADAEEEPDRLAYALHIIDKKDADKTVTRGDAAGIVVRLLGYDDANMESGDIFDDVGSSDKNAAAIYTAWRLGLISGTEDALYEPDEPVTYVQLAKMIVQGLGYEQDALNLGGFPTGYLVAAGKMGLDKGVAIEDQEKLDGRTVAQIVENALNTVMYPQENIVPPEDNTLLYQAFRLRQYRGVVTAAYAKSYTPNSYAQELDDVYINDTRYKIGESSVADLIGYTVDFYVRDGEADPQTVVFAEKRGYREQVIDPEYVNDVTVDRNGITIDYFKSPDAKRATTEQLSFETTSLIYNGIYTDITKSEEDLLDFSDGSIKLIDNNEDGTWEYLVVEQSTTVVVKTYSASTRKLSFEYAVELGAASAQTLDLTQYDSIVFEGALQEAELTAGNVLEIWMPKNDVFSQKAVRISTSNRIVRAELTEKRSEDGKDYLIMGDQTYELTDDYASYAPELFDSMQNGVEYTMYLTESGKVAYIIDHLEEERVYGYVTNMSIGLFDAITMKVYMNDGQFHYFEFADKVRVYRDGVDEGMKTPQEATAGFFKDKAFDVSQAQLIRFLPNRESKVRLIEFAQTALGEEAAIEGSKEGQFIKSRDNFTADYYYISKVLYTDRGSEFPLPDTVPCFTIPADPADYNEVTNFSTGTYNPGGNVSITVDTYGSDEVGVPEVVVRYGSPDAHQDFNLNTAVTVVQDVVESLGPDGEPCMKLIDVLGNEYLALKEDNVFMDQVTGEQVKRGDVVQIGPSKGGYVQFIDMMFFTDPSAPNGHGYTYSDPSAHIRNTADSVIASGTRDYPRILAAGYVVALTPQYIKIQNAAGEHAIFSQHDYNHYLYTVYPDSDFIERTMLDQLNVGDYIMLRSTYSDLQEVVRYIDE